MLAAGASTRMRGQSKLLADIGGRPVVEAVVATARASTADPVVVVVGHRAREVGEHVADRAVIVENPAYESGLSSSLATGIRALPDDVDGAVVLLGDMPRVEPTDVDALIAAFDPKAPCVPVVDGRWANPVLWPRAFFARIVALEGDRGARSILEEQRDRVIEVPRDNPGLLFDIDTRQDLQRARSDRA